MSCGCNDSPYPCPDHSVRFRQDTATQWLIHDPILKSGEPGYETDTGAWKLGDGTSVWTQLAYQPAIGTQGPAGPAGPQGIPGVAGSLRIGLVTTGAVASASITGDPPNQVLNLVLPTSGGGGSSSGVFFSVQPSSANGTVGQSVTFTASAQSDETPISYVWQKSYDGSTWTSAGSTTTILIFQVASVADNGLLFRCKATVPSGASAYSLVASLSLAGTGLDPLLGAPAFDPYPAVLAPATQTAGGITSPSPYSGMPGVRFKDIAVPAGTTLTGAYKSQYKAAGGEWTDCSNTRAWWVQVSGSATDVLAPYFVQPTRPTNQNNWGSISDGVLIYGTPINEPLTFRVAAIGSKGAGAWSVPTNAVTPTNSGG